MLPPTDLHERSLPLIDILPGALFRAHALRYHPIHFNRTHGRWASPTASFGTMYLSTRPEGAFVEAFGDAWETSVHGVVVSRSRLQHACLCAVQTQRTLRLVDLTVGPALKRVAGDSRLANAAHTHSQQWAQQFHDHPDQPDGVFYRARQAPEMVSVALFERVRPVLHAACAVNLLRDDRALAGLLAYYGCMLV